jgi:hypothetical protein
MGFSGYIMVMFWMLVYDRILLLRFFRLGLVAICPPQVCFASIPANRVLFNTRIIPLYIVVDALSKKTNRKQSRNEVITSVFIPVLWCLNDVGDYIIGLSTAGAMVFSLGSGLAVGALACGGLVLYRRLSSPVPSEAVKFVEGRLVKKSSNLVPDQPPAPEHPTPVPVNNQLDSVTPTPVGDNVVSTISPPPYLSKRYLYQQLQMLIRLPNRSN